MSGSVYLTHLMTMCAVSLNDRRKSCAFMSFLDKLGRGGGVKCFLIRARESNSPHVPSVPETTGKDPKNLPYRGPKTRTLPYLRGHCRSAWSEDVTKAYMTDNGCSHSQTYTRLNPVCSYVTPVFNKKG